MAKLRRTPLEAADISAILGAECDFPFEMSVLAHLESLGFACQHSGTYVDPASQKLRQFDIRAKIIPRPFHHVYLAVECKNIQPHYPLVVHCVPRKIEESRLCLYRFCPMRGDFSLAAHLVAFETLFHSGENSWYPPTQPLGKRFDQVGRAQDTDGTPQISDSDVFSKLTQAVSSCRDLIDAAVSSNSLGLHAVVPVLVVPDGTLWSIEYTSAGALSEEARPVNHVTFFLGQEYPISAGVARSFHLTHLEILTLSELNRFATDLKESTSLFPAEWRPEWAQ